MSDLTGLLLTALLNYGALMLGITLFLAALGLPLPASVVLIAAGAFAQQGALGAQEAAAAALAGAVLGDSGSYGLGRFAAVRIPPRMRASALWTRATALFARWGLLGIYLTRFLLTPVALPVNLLAGSTRYPWPRYLAAVVAGEATWVALFGGAGYAFAQQWESISSLVSDGGGVLLGGVLVVLAGRWLWRQRLRPRP
jgi:membrane protein DedA with SNARE-associated domain